MASSWDRCSAAETAALQGKALAEQVSERLARYQPYWRETVRGSGVRAADIRTVADLGGVPAVGERDLCPDGDPVGAARLVLRAGEADFTRQADGALFRRALWQRLTAPAAYRRTVDDVVRPLVFHQAGLALGFPIASTRADLDLVARAGARMWQVLGLGPADVLVSAIPAGGNDLPAFALPYAAIGGGAPAVHAGPDGAAEALATVPATVVAVPDAAGLDALLDAYGDYLPPSVTTVLVTGDPAGVAASAGETRVLRVWGPGEGRWLWAECAPGSGLHTYPDLEIVETLDPASAEPAAEGEPAVTQLGVAGSALVRWRTGALGRLEAGPCPRCGRTVPRLGSDVTAGALVTAAEVGGRAALLDLRAVAGALAGRPDLAGWTVTREGADGAGAPLVVVRVAPAGGVDPGDAAVGAYRDVEAVAGVGPTQVVVEPRAAGRADVRV